MADNLYIDMLHDQLYAKHSSSGTLTGTRATTIGLSDFVELPATMSWYIRSIRFRWQGYTDTTDPSVDFEGTFCAGIVNRDISAAAYPEPGDFQDVAGWFLNGTYMNILVPNTPYHGAFSWTKTYKPSKNLELNREQNIVMACKKISGAPAPVLMSMYIHAERGH